MKTQSLLFKRREQEVSLEDTEANVRIDFDDHYKSRSLPFINDERKKQRDKNSLRSG